MLWLLGAYLLWCWLRLINADVRVSVASFILAPLLLPVFVIFVIITTIMEARK